MKERLFCIIITSYLYLPLLLGQEDKGSTRLRLEDLIGAPVTGPLAGPGLPTLSYELPELNTPQLNEENLFRGLPMKKKGKSSRFSFHSSPINPFPAKTAATSNVALRYALTDKLSLQVSGQYYFDTYKSAILPRSVNRAELGVGMTYWVTRRLELKTGVHYQFNVIKKRWEWAFLTGAAFHF